jgi:ATP-binding cassette subfamily C protein
VILALIASGFEIVGAALVFALIQLVADPTGEIQLPILGDLRAFTGLTDRTTFLISSILAVGLFFLLRAAVQIMSVYAQRRVVERAGANLSIRLVGRYLGWPYQDHLQRHSTELIRNGHQAVQQVVLQVFLAFIRIAAETLVTVGLVTLLATIAPRETALALLIVGVAGAILLLFVQPRLKRLGFIAHSMQRETLMSLQQALQGIRDIKLLGQERYFANRYADSRLSLARANYMKAVVQQLPTSLVELALLLLTLLLFGLTISAGANDSLPVLGLFAYAALRLEPSLQRIIGGLNDIRYSSAPVEDLRKDLGADQERTEIKQKPQLSFQQGIAFDDVGFRYPASEGVALMGITMEIGPGETLGICGPTGGGKTTLLDLLTGLLAPTTGRVVVDGVDLADCVSAWQHTLGVVSQTPFLVDDTLRRNIALGTDDGDVDDQALAEAVELSQLSSFVAGLPEGLETKVGERGVRLSGGQRQRVAIARALYRRPAMLIFDEATSALDNLTEAELLAAIERLRGRLTIVIVAHRLSTISRVDRVIFVEDGRITGSGTYDELMVNHRHFRQMATA